MLFKCYVKKFGVILLTVMLVLSGNSLLSRADTNESQVKGGINLNRYVFNPNGKVEPTNTTYLPWYAKAGTKADFFDNNGNYNIVYENDDKENIYIARFNNKLSVVDTLKIKRELPLLGSAICDNEGNYYILYGKYVNEDEKDAQNVVIAKYDSHGQKINSYSAIGSKMSSSGTKEPFNYANASMTINGNVLAAFFGRVMFKSTDGLNHQSSTVLYVDKNNMTLLDMPIPYNSHSFDQQAIPTSDGGFLFVDRGDAYARGFKLTKILNNKSYPFETFHFRETTTYQNTLSTLGGIAENSSGYALLGTSDKVLSNTVIDPKDASSRNLFIQVVKKDFNKYKSPSDKMVSIGVKRETEGIKNNTGLNTTGGVSYFLPADASDYGVVWLTDYSGSVNAMNPKMVALSNDTYAILWEKWDGNKFVETNLVLVDGSGKEVMPPTVIPKARLCENERPLLKDGKIYWSVSFGSSITIYSLTINDPSITSGVVNVAPLLNSKITFDETSVTIPRGYYYTITYSLPADYEGEKLTNWSSSDPSVATADVNGRVSALAAGTANISLKSSDSSLSASCTVTVAPTVPERTSKLNKYQLDKKLGEELLMIANKNELVFTHMPKEIGLNDALIYLKDSDGNKYNEQYFTNRTDERIVYKLNGDNSSGSSNLKNGVYYIQFYVNNQGNGTYGGYIWDKSIPLTYTQDNSYFEVVPDYYKTIEIPRVILNKTSDKIIKGNQKQLIARISSDEEQDEEDASNNINFTWTSSDTKVATVSQNGNITSVSVGTATITATTKDENKFSSSCLISVVPLLISNISLDRADTTINRGGSCQLTPKVYPENADNNALTWSSSNTKIATVDKNGKVKAIAKGVANISVAVDGSKIKATCKVTVK